MKKINYIALIIIAGLAFTFSSCLKDLDTRPLDDNEITAADVFDDPAAYREFLAKLYAGLAVSGQQGPAGMADISGIDEGFGQYLRGFWYHQVLTTDEALIGWDDQTIKDFIYHSWGASDVFVTAMYYRIFYQISLANEYIRETTDAKLNDRGVSGTLRDQIEVYRAEARFLRALSYWHALDIFANVPFVTEEDPVGAFLPEQIQRADLFDYIESELIDIQDLMVAPRQNEYGRADRAAAWMLLAKLYLNAEVYTGQPMYDKVIDFTTQIINAGYEIEDEYANLFNADNNPIDHPDFNEVIFAIRYDGTDIQTYGGTNFIIHAQVGGDMSPSAYGVDGGWGGLRTTPQMVEMFDDDDGRAMFFTDGQTLEIPDLGNFENGYAVVKFTNIRRDGTQGSRLDFVDTDFPMFRLGDVYLMYAEAHLRNGGGDAATALAYVNELRERAFGDNSGNINGGQLTLDFILDERARELYWEGHRRTDLIRFGSFTGDNYLWSWKGNIQEGAPTNSKFNIFPIPFSDTSANPNLVQNDGY
ncbi:MAG: RagB/SusD family nutrient uptake outer membrane protein [Bacteroidales bacterium]|nr:RagB/SusD family nutrient uptake outer membrane protein [Bacteroidales bacterium]